ncbi:MAG: ParB/RepB/Spo0J family partition protein [Clostridia bacterium]|nr:ParB/RepB/Spo0J family partition protein [Clostridia bacterium]
MAKKLGKGISQLLANVEDERINAKSDKILFIAVGSIKPNPGQPRKSFGEEGIAELAESIREYGILQPLVLKKDGDSYIIVAGERRYRAAKLAGVQEVPAIIKELTDQKTREISLIENLQREDLNAIEAAEALKELMDSYDLTQEDVAKRIGKARPSIANTLRLLMLDKRVQQMVREDRLSAGHARTLIPVTNTQDQIRMANLAAADGLSVRELEKMVRYYLHPEKQPKKMNDEQKARMTSEMRAFADRLNRVFMTKVKLIGNEQKGRITIDYFSKDDLERIYEMIDKLSK